MQERVYSIPFLPEKLADLDITPAETWIGVTGPGAHQSVYFHGSPIPIPASCRFPIIRAVDDTTFVLADQRSDKKAKNLWVMNSEGAILSNFEAGDAISNILPFSNGIAVTYFDEAFGSSRNLDGLVHFDYEGKVVFHHSELDCYCACSVDKNHLLTLFYPEFHIRLFDLRTGKHTAWVAPQTLAGAAAVTCVGDVAYFHGNYDDRNIIQRWEFGATNASSIDHYNSVLRGIRGGLFIATGTAGYTLVSIAPGII